MKEELKQYESLKKEIAEIKRRIEAGSEKIRKLENKYLVSDSVSGGEGGRHRYKIQGFPSAAYERQKSQIYMSRLRLERLEKKLEEAAAQVEEFIADAPDSRTRRVLMFRYMDGLPWNDVARSMGAGYTPDMVKQICSRYLRRFE